MQNIYKIQASRNRATLSVLNTALQSLVNQLFADKIPMIFRTIPKSWRPHNLTFEIGANSLKHTFSQPKSRKFVTAAENKLKPTPVLLKHKMYFINIFNKDCIN